MLTTEDIARICWEVRRAIIQAGFNIDAPPWDEADESDQVAYLDGVVNLLKNPNLFKEHHEQWMDLKLRKGWRYGYVISRTSKTHPKILPYSQLPPLELAKHNAILAIVDTCKRINAAGADYAI